MTHLCSEMPKKSKVFFIYLNAFISHFVYYFLRYPKYKFFGDADIAKTAAVATRYSDNSLFGIIIDIHFLSISDYLVCTFSSQV
jgi:hypothetical protein